jgi:hypothetical protein
MRAASSESLARDPRCSSFILRSVSSMSFCSCSCMPSGLLRFRIGFGPGPEGSALIGGGQETLTIDRRTGPNSTFEQSYEPWKILVFTAEVVEHPRSQTRSPHARPSVVVEELRPRMRETLAVYRADHCEVVDTLRNMGKRSEHSSPDCPNLLNVRFDPRTIDSANLPF